MIGSSSRIDRGLGAAAASSATQQCEEESKNEMASEKMVPVTDRRKVLHAREPAEPKSRAGTAHLHVNVPYRAKVVANFKGGAMETSFDTAYFTVHISTREGITELLRTQLSARAGCPLLARDPYPRTEESSNQTKKSVEEREW